MRRARLTSNYKLLLNNSTPLGVAFGADGAAHYLSSCLERRSRLVWAMAF